MHDFFLYYVLRFGYAPGKIYRIAGKSFAGVYDDETILKWLKKFYWRFFAQQFKRSCLPDGPKVGIRRSIAERRSAYAKRCLRASVAERA